MNDHEVEAMASKVSDRILAAVHTAERLRAVEVQTNRIAMDLDSEKESRAVTNEKVDSKLDGLQAQIGLLNKSNWTAAGAIGAVLVLWDIAKHFIKF